jgi:signal transduction histidine kinase
LYLSGSGDLTALGGGTYLAANFSGQATPRPMHLGRSTTLSGMLLVLSLGGCDVPPIDHSWVAFDSIETVLLVEDLNSDGFSETIMRVPNQAPGQGDQFLLGDGTGKVIEQMITGGRVLSPPSAIDLDREARTKELFFGANRNDSLFLDIFDHRGQAIRLDIPLLAGKKRRDSPGVVIDWEAATHFELRQMDDTPALELITVVGSSQAGLPRGILVHSWPEGQLLDSLNLGAALSKPTVTRDIDGDGLTEMVFHSSTPRQGASAGGFDDSHSYLISIEMRLPLRVDEFLEAQAENVQMRPFFGSFEGFPGNGILTVELANRDVRTNSRLIYSEFGSPLSRSETYNLPEPLQVVGTADLDGDGRREIYGITRGNDLVYLRRNRVIRRQPQDQRLSGIAACPDIDDDGREELCAIGSTVGTRFFRENLTVKTTAPILGPWKFSTTQEGLIWIGRDKTYIHTTSANNRYRAISAWVAVLISAMAALALAGLSAFRLFQQSRRLAELRQLPVPVYAVESGHARPLNEAATKLGSLPELSGGKLAHGLSSIGELRVLTIPVGRGTIAVVLDGRMEKSVSGWKLMTSRVAHDIKNPLTSILLTLDRLRVEIEDQEPGAAERAAPFLDRIENRVDLLRRRSRQVMKEAGAAECNRSLFVLEDLAKEVVDGLSDVVPSDVDVRFKAGTAGGVIRFDPDLFYSAVENVIHNALQAMQEGGILTFRTSWVGERLLALQISDTGCGMTALQVRYAFEPGFSGREGGTGLGLCLAKSAMERHGGGISIVSEPGNGTEVELRFPFASHEGSQSHQAGEE